MSPALLARAQISHDGLEAAAAPRRCSAWGGRHVDLADARRFFPPSEAKGGLLPRVIYLTPTAMEVKQRLIRPCAAGPHSPDRSSSSRNFFNSRDELLYGRYPQPDGR